jgi:hypothetical protein
MSCGGPEPPANSPIASNEASLYQHQFRLLSSFVCGEIGRGSQSISFEDNDQCTKFMTEAESKRLLDACRWVSSTGQGYIS